MSDACAPGAIASSTSTRRVAEEAVQAAGAAERRVAEVAAARPLLADLDAGARVAVVARHRLAHAHARMTDAGRAGEPVAAGLTFLARARARATEAGIRAELMATCQNYKNMIEHIMVVQTITVKRAELAEREVSVLRGGS